MLLATVGPFDYLQLQGSFAHMFQEYILPWEAFEELAESFGLRPYSVGKGDGGFLLQ